MTLNAAIRCSLLLLGAWQIPATLAAPIPQSQQQAPGYYRVMIGSAQVTALYDGSSTFGLKLFNHDDASVLAGYVSAVQGDAPKVVNGSVNSFLIANGEHLILVDTGGGKLLGPGFGQMMTNLKAAGYRPEQVDTVLLTHMHPDHIGGLVTAEGKPAFPNATVWAAAAEADYWLSAKNAASAPADGKKGFEQAQAILSGLKQAGKFKTFSGDKTVLPGIKAVSLPGHTPGSSGYLLEQGGQSMLFWGDTLHYAALQLPHPQLSIAYDSNGAQAVKTRSRLLHQVAAEKTLVAAAHITFPGIGYVYADGKQGYGWTPIGYGEVR